MAWLNIIGNKGGKSLFGALASKGMSKMTILTSLVAMLLFVGNSSLKAQIDYPVQANVVVLPPYSVYLTDYYAKGSQQLKVQLLLKEISRPSFQVKLRFKITGSALTLTSRDGVTLPPFTVQGGTTIEAAGDQLAAYLSQNALVASGADAHSFINNGQRMADGFYKIEVWAEEMLRSVRVSNVATTFISTALYQPPMITSPMDKSTIADMGMQNIAFQWLPRHMSASVDVVQSTYYKIRLVEIWPKERDAVEAIRNSNALYEGLTNSTMFLYGIDQPTLISGRRYALQIQAQTADQRDLFVNQGFSNIISFTYGQECVAPQGFNVTVDGPTSATALWSGTARNNSYNVQYRKVYGSDTTWHETIVAAPTYKLTNLVPKSSYQVKVSGNCGLAKSIYTPERTFTTSGLDTPFDCGKSSTIPTITNRTPKTSLAIGDEIHAADFDVKIIMWAQVNGNQFTGVGIATIPFLRNAPAPCKFDNIQVNSENQLIGGSIVIAEDVKLDDNTLREAGRLAGDAENALSGGANSQVTTTILTTTFKGSPVVTPIAQTYPTPATAKVTINTADGQAITAPAGSNSRYVDSDGNVISVAQNGAVTTGKIDKNAFGKGASSSASASVASGSSFPLVTFSANPTKIKYGYDMPRTNSAFPDSYQSLGSRKIGWMSVATGATDVAQASIDFQQSGLKTTDIRFRTSEGEVVDATTDNPAQVTIKGYSSNATTPIMAVVSKTEKDTEKPYICGQLNSVGYDLNRLRLYLVPVNGATIDAAGVKTTLNNIYKQAAIEWDVEYSPKELSLTLTPEELAAVCANIDANELSNYSPGMLAALHKLDREPDANNYELFIINGTANGVKGFMPLNRSAGFIFTGNQSAAEVQQTIAHELGHGAFGLEHVGKAAGKTATDNLMDYNSGVALDKPQWDLIHGEHRRLTWFQGEEEGKWTTDGHYYTVQLVALMMGFEKDDAYKLGAASEYPDTKVYSDKIMKEKDTWVRPEQQQRYHALTGGFHGVELAITAYAFTKTHTDNNSGYYLIHRFGDCFAHFNIRFDTYNLSTSVNLERYVKAIDDYIDGTFVFLPENAKILTSNGETSLSLSNPYLESSNGKIQTCLSRNDIAFKLIDYLLTAEQSLTIMSVPILPPIYSTFATKTLTEHWEGILAKLPPAAQNRFEMYGSDVQVGCFTNGHLGRDADNIIDRFNLYKLYISKLEELLLLKYNLTPKTNYQQNIETLLNNIYDVAKYTSINRLDGILNFEIAKQLNPNVDEFTFAIPVKFVNYSETNGIASTFIIGSKILNYEDYSKIFRSGINYDFNNLTQSSQEIIDNTFVYFDKAGLFKKYFISCQLQKGKINYWLFKIKKI